MKQYLVPFLVYIAALPLLDLFGLSAELAYIIRTIATGALLLYYMKEYNFKKFTFSWLGVLTGLVIFVLWISLEQVYSQLPSTTFDPSLVAPGLLFTFFGFKILGMFLVAPFMEELFTRSFLLRFFIDPKWEKVPIGKYTLASFIITTLFFGFSHAMWLPGLFTGALLTLLLYKTKDLWSCIQAHAVANIALYIFVISTQQWAFL